MDSCNFRRYRSTNPGLVQKKSPKKRSRKGVKNTSREKKKGNSPKDIRENPEIRGGDTLPPKHLRHTGSVPEGWKLKGDGQQKGKIENFQKERKD